MIVAIFDPTAKTTDTFNTNVPVGGKFILINQSNVNLTLKFADGSTLYGPAWQMSIFSIPTTNPNVTWYQQSILAGTVPISQVTIDAYKPSESIPGTYPVSIQHTAFIPNQVSTSAVFTSLSNEGNAAGTEVIDIGTSGNSKLIDIFNDHFVWSIEQSGVKHQIFLGRTSGKPLALGQAGDHVEILGVLDIDQSMFVVGNTQLDNGLLSTDGLGHLRLNNAVSLQAKNASGTAKSILRVDASNNLILQEADNNTLQVLKSDGTLLLTIDASGNITSNGTIGVSSSGDVLDGSGFDTFLASRGAGNIVHLRSGGTDNATFDSNGIHLQRGTIGLLGGSLSRLNGTASNCGNGTVISHGLGATPTFVTAFAWIAQPGSATSGGNNANGTSVTYTVGAGTQIAWLAGVS